MYLILYHTHTYTYIHTYINAYKYTGLEISEFALPNVNHFWDNCELLWPTDSQYFWVTVNQFRPIANHFY